jgi:hypothetical protein
MVLTWRAHKALTVDYSMRVALADESGRVVASWEGYPVHSSWPTSNWRAGQLVRDPWKLRLPENVKPDSPYRLKLQLFNAQGDLAGEKELGTVLVSRHARSGTIPRMQHPLDAVWNQAFRLLGYDLRVVSGSSNSGWLELDLYWQSLAATETDYVVSIQLVNAQEQPVLSYEGHPVAGNAPTSSWQEGEVVQDFHSVPYENLSGDKYWLKVALRDPQTREPLPVEIGGDVAHSVTLASWP